MNSDLDSCSFELANRDMREITRQLDPAEGQKLMKMTPQIVYVLRKKFYDKYMERLRYSPLDTVIADNVQDIPPFLEASETLIY